MSNYTRRSSWRVYRFCYADHSMRSSCGRFVCMTSTVTKLWHERRWMPSYLPSMTWSTEDHPLTPFTRIKRRPPYNTSIKFSRCTSDRWMGGLDGWREGGREGWREGGRGGERLSGRDRRNERAGGRRKMNWGRSRNVQVEEEVGNVLMSWWWIRLHQIHVCVNWHTSVLL